MGDSAYSDLIVSDSGGTRTRRACRELADDAIVGYAVRGNAAPIVGGDSDLPDLNEYLEESEAEVPTA